MIDYYEDLKVSPGATQEAIRAQYLFLLQAFHPDKFAGAGREKHLAQAEAETKKLNQAYEVLNNPVSRRDFDRQREAEFARGRGASGTPPRRPPPPPPSRPASTPPPPPSPLSINPLRVGLIVASVILCALLIAKHQQNDHESVATKAGKVNDDDKRYDAMAKLVPMTPGQAYAFGFGEIKPQFDGMMENVQDQLYPGSIVNEARRTHGQVELTKANVAAEMRAICASVEQSLDPDMHERGDAGGVRRDVVDAYAQGRLAGVAALANPAQQTSPADDSSQVLSPATASLTSETPSKTARAAEISPLGDLTVQRHKGEEDNDGNADEILIACVDGSRQPEHLCNHDWRSGQLSFSPDEHWIVVTDGGGPGSSMGTTLRAFRRETENIYHEIQDAGIEDRAAEAALRSRNAPQGLELDHTYAVVRDWSNDGRTLRVSVWGHGAGYSLDLTDVAIDTSMIWPNYHHLQSEDNRTAPNRTAPTNAFIEETGRIEEAGVARNQADAELNAIYKKLMASLTPAQQKQLRDEERAWIKWRDTQADRLAIQSNAPGGDYLTNNLNAMTGLIQKRTQALTGVLENVRSAPFAGLQKRLPNGAVADPYANDAAVHPQPAAPATQQSVTLTRVYTVPELKKLVGTRPAGAGLRGDFVLVKREGDQVLLQSRADLRNFGITSSTNGKEDVYRGHTFVSVNCSRDMSRFISGQLVTIPAEQALQIISVSKNSQGEINVEASF